MSCSTYSCVCVLFLVYPVCQWSCFLHFFLLCRFLLLGIINPYILYFLLPTKLVVSFTPVCICINLCLGPHKPQYFCCILCRSDRKELQFGGFLFFLLVALVQIIPTGKKANITHSKFAFLTFKKMNCCCGQHILNLPHQLLLLHFRIHHYSDPNFLLYSG